MHKQLINHGPAVFRISTIMLLLLSGLVVYWLFRPEIYFLQFMHLVNTQPLISDNYFLWWLKNYYADAAWCVALILSVKMLRDHQVHYHYTRLLVALPFLSEMLQAAGISPGTFDWLDLILYLGIYILLFYKEVFAMQNHMKNIIAVSTIAVFAAAIIASASPPKKPRVPIKYINAVFTLPVKQDELFTKDRLPTVLNSASIPSIVLRVPAPGKTITAEQKQKNSVLYNTIEKEFAIAGFIVRDRLLFGKVLEREDLDYAKIGQVTKTDLILELLNYDINQPYRTRQYLDEEDGQLKRSSVDITFNSATVEFKLVSVKENDMMGSYTFYYTPCADGCKHRFSESSRAKGTWKYSNSIPKDFFIESSRKLIREIKARR